METKMQNLEELRDAMVRSDPSVLDLYGQWRSDLPTFGGPPPEGSGIEVWSWDDNRLLVGVAGYDLEIVPRAKLFELWQSIV